MNDASEEQLRALLHAADPAAGLPAADPAEVDRTLRRVVDTDLRQTGTRRRNALTWLVAAAAVVVIAVGTVWWTRSDRSESGVVASSGGSSTAATPSATQLRMAATDGRCLVPTAAQLAAQPMAFEATVVGIADGVVTLRPTSVFAGEVADEVSVAGAVSPAGSIEGDVDFEVGGTYLVAATDGQVRGCGLSGPVSRQLTDLYAQAFGR